MAITRLSNSGIKTGGVLKYDTALAGYPPVMAAPTATDGGTGSTASVAFTAVSGATSYTAISTPGSFTATGASSPLTVSGLTAGTSYTFQVSATNAVGTGGLSAPSNSVTPAVPFSFDSIASVLATGGDNTYTFSSIPQTYKHLQFRINARMTGSTSPSSVRFRINGNSSSIYTNKWIRASQNIAPPSILVQNDNVNSFIYGNRGMAGGSSSSGLYAVLILDILNYSSTSVNKTFRMASGMFDRSDTGQTELMLGTGTPLTNSAISSITVFCDNSFNFGVNSSIALYGIRG